MHGTLGAVVDHLHVDHETKLLATSRLVISGRIRERGVVANVCELDLLANGTVVFDSLVDFVHQKGGGGVQLGITSLAWH